MSRTLKGTAAALALIAALGSAAQAQTAPAAPDAPTPPAPQAQGQAPAVPAPPPGAADTAPTPPPPPAEPVAITEDTLPDLLKALDLQDIDIDRERRGTEVEGSLPDGTDIEAMLDAQGALRMIRADDDAALPAAVVDALVPDAVRGADIFAEFAQIEGIGIAPADHPMQGMMIFGSDDQGEDLRAAFAEDGSLTRFGRGDDDGFERGPKHGGKHGGKHGDKGDHGPEGWMHGARGDGPRGERRGGPDQRQGMAPEPMDQAAVTTTLADAGYTGLGNVRQDGPRVMVDATNAAGEAVIVELGPQGDVVRETAR